jgi:hypothetical protein
MARLARAAHLSIEGVVYDSTEFQFVGSELYEQDIPLTSLRTGAPSPGGSIFSAEQLEAFRGQAADLNAAERGDQAAFYLRRM